MRILVKSRKWVEDRLDKDLFFYRKHNFISIFSSGDYSPFPKGCPGLLELEFDDITDKHVSPSGSDGNPLILFQDDHAARIIRFVHGINRKKMLVVHCDAGVSRSGAVGLALNEYCNRVLENNPNDYALFSTDNPDIVPNLFILNRMRDLTRPGQQT